MTRAFTRTVSCLMVIACLAPPAGAQQSVIDSLRLRIAGLESDVSQLKTSVNTLEFRQQTANSETESTLDSITSEAYAPVGALLFTIAVFCALWAQNTRRNPWLWFFMGFLFHGITMLAMLIKNARGRRRDAARVPPGSFAPEPRMGDG
jgi:hypothetical protein